ncbi:hypothetical protein ACFO0N_00490 [Halobium salinum]|uniref:Small multi-drug export protein n=1 Tax=Halobium salinum TaxID=1364940 RepID=A0ABD5P7G3_9EURY|nr:hypothetical protein [Halobium salinum]
MSFTDPKSAALGSEELAFWPVITFSLLYVGDDEFWVVPVLFVLGLSGGVTFIVFGNIRKWVEETDGESEEESDVLRILEEVHAGVPENWLSQGTLLLGIALNFGAGLYLWPSLVNLGNSDASVVAFAVAVLAVLPLLWIGTFFGALVWSR